MFMALFGVHPQRQGQRRSGIRLGHASPCIADRTIAFSNDPRDERRDTAVAERSREPEETTWIKGLRRFRQLSLQPCPSTISNSLPPSLGRRPWFESGGLNARPGSVGQGRRRLLVVCSAESERVKPWSLATICEMEVDLERRIRDITEGTFSPTHPVTEGVAGNGSRFFARESRKRLTRLGVDQLNVNPAAFYTIRVDVQFGGIAPHDGNRRDASLFSVVLQGHVRESVKTHCRQTAGPFPFYPFRSAESVA